MTICIDVHFSNYFVLLRSSQFSVSVYVVRTVLCLVRFFSLDTYFISFFSTIVVAFFSFIVCKSFTRVSGQKNRFKAANSYRRIPRAHRDIDTEIRLEQRQRMTTTFVDIHKCCIVCCMYIDWLTNNNTNNQQQIQNNVKKMWKRENRVLTSI